MTRFSYVAVASLAILAAACTDTPTTPQASIAGPQFAAAGTDGTSDWIVMFDDSTADAPGKSRKVVGERKGILKRTYQHGMRGFAATLTDADAIALANTPGVRRVERDGIARINESVTAASWGLDRIDQRLLPLNNTYTFTGTGAGVRVYIIDTGILTSHVEFGGRAVGGSQGFTAFSDSYGTTDCNGHGTHVAGTVGGSSTGVARGVTLVAVRVMDCAGSGSWSGVIAGLDWMVGQKQQNPSVAMAANMSIGGSLSSSLNDAVQRAIGAGITVAVAAGNEGVDACTKSPSSAANALTVGATESSDARAYYSNYGSCLDIFAPGSGITSSYIGSTGSYASLSGTSMASPHVAGAAALILGSYPSYSPNQVRSAMMDSATAGVVTSAGSGSPNALLNTSFGAATVTPPPPPPPVDTTTPPTPVISLTVAKTKTGKWNSATLDWNGATTSNVDIYRNDQRLVTTANDGRYADNKLSSTSFSYRVCQAGSTSVCSPSVSVAY